MNKRLLFLLLCYLTIIPYKSATCTALANGDWANAATWSCGHSPACGDVVIIPINITVTITSQQNYSACTPTPAASLQIYIYGCLFYVTGNKLTLPCGSNVYLAATGSMVPGGGGGNSNYLEICNNNVWNAASGTATGPAAFCGNPPCSTAPLPIELISFTGEFEQKVVYLNWKTATETNNDHYDIEKSYNRMDFQKIMSVQSKAPNGTSLGPLDYQITDPDLKHPLYYYRLKQVDKNGNSKLTNSISVKIYAGEFSIYPNPNTGVFSIEVPGTNLHEELTTTIYNNLGELVHQSVQSIINDNITGSHIDVSPSKPLPKGIYLTTISFQGEIHQLKLVVQ